jgi:phage terminase large subunit
MKSLYRPRQFFNPFHGRKHRWFYLVAHRRAGKTVAAINDILEKALYNTREAPRYGYVGPLLKQAKQIAWDYLKKFSAPYSPKVNESELYVELTSLPNSPRISIYGADNPDAFRGLYFDGVVLDEFGNMRGSIFEEILLPALIDRSGWCVFMGTPNGPNHFRDAWYDADRQPTIYGKLFLPVTSTKIIPDSELEMMKKMMDPEQFAQEMLCSFEASVRGAVYARQMERVAEEGRIGDFPLQPNLYTNLVMDLGFDDACTMIFFQERPDGICIGHAHSDNLKPIKTYIKYAKDFWGGRRLKQGKIHLPHDAKARSLQTGKSIIDHFRKAELRPKLVPDLDLLDGIAATRTTFPSFYFHEPETVDLVLALKSYHYKYDEERKIFVGEPVHNWASHYADNTRYLSIVANPKAAEQAQKDPYADLISGMSKKPEGVKYGFTLNQIWDLGPTQSSRL